MTNNCINFTKAALSALPSAPPGKRTTYNDTKAKGLQLRVTHSGVKTFSVYRWIKGAAKPERLTLGTFPELTIEQSRLQATKINAAIAQGENPSELLRRKKAELTFGELFTTYLQRHARPHKRTWREDKSKYLQYLSTKKEGINLSTRLLSTIDRSTIASIHAKIGQTKPIAANRVLALISSVFGRAVEWGLWEQSNPVRGIKRFKETSRERFLGASELPRFFSALDLEPSEVLRDFFHICLFTGARRSNVLSMRWDQIDFASSEWIISKTKNGTPQTVPLVADAEAILLRRQAKAQSPYVFPGRGRTGHLAEPRKGFERIIDRDELTQLAERIRATGFAAKTDESLLQALSRARDIATKRKIDTSGTRLADLRIHDLRRTLGSWQAKTGASMLIIGKTLHHKSHVSTQVYARLDNAPIRESMNKAVKAIHSASSNNRGSHHSED